MSWLVLIFTIVSYAWFFGVWFQSANPTKKKGRKGKLKFAVVIPAHNEEQLIGKTLQSVKRGAVKAGISPSDIFVLLNGCTDRTEEEVLSAGVKALVIPRRGKAETIHYATHHLGLFKNYTHVCFLDADTLVDPEYFSATKKCLMEDASIDIVCGRPKSLPFNWLTAHRAVQYWKLHAFHKPAQAKIKSILVAPGCASTLSREVVESVSWVTGTLMEDMSVTIQATFQGRKIFFEPKAIVYTQDPPTLPEYSRQLYTRWYAGVWLNLKKYKILWKGNSFLHWDCRLIIGEQLLCFSMLIPYRIFCQLAGLSWNPQGALLFFLLTLLAETVISTVLCAIFEKRADVLKYMPAYIFLWVVDFTLFLGASKYLFKTVKTESWKPPKRIEFNL